MAGRLLCAESDFSILDKFRKSFAISIAGLLWFEKTINFAICCYMKKSIKKYLNNALVLVLIIFVYSLFFQTMYCWMYYGHPVPDGDWASFLYSLPFNFIPFLIIAVAAVTVVSRTSRMNCMWKKIVLDIVVVTIVEIIVNLLFPVVTGLSVNWGGTTFNCVMIWLGIEFWSVNRQKRKALVRESMLLKENAAYKFELLQSYVNPHFLFNSLEMLCSMIEMDEKELSLSFIDRLTAYYRGMLRRKNVLKIPLKDELETVSDYLAIVSRHYEDNLKVSVFGDREAGIFVVPFSLQLLVENVLKHNIISAAMPLEIAVDITDSGITVSNRCQPKSEGKARGGGLGLKYLRNMYAAHGKDITVKKDGDMFSVTVPAL